MSPWDSHELVWLGESTGLTGSDLTSLRLFYAPQRVFHSGPDDPISLPPIDGPSVLMLELIFTPDGGRRFREIERELDEEQRRDLLHSRGLALLVGERLFLAFLGVFRSRGPEPQVTRMIQLTGRDFDEVVSFIEDGLGCEGLRDRRILRRAASLRIIGAEEDADNLEAAATAGVFWSSGIR